MTTREDGIESRLSRQSVGALCNLLNSMRPDQVPLPNFLVRTSIRRPDCLPLYNPHSLTASWFRMGIRPGGGV